MKNRILHTSLLGLGLLTLAGQTQASPTCAAPSRLIQFPTGSPVWEFCLLTPSQSSGTDGSGIEIREAFYNGHKVFKRAHTPVLNVKYVSGAACNCYRDWIDEEGKFKVVTSASNPNAFNIAGSGNYAEAIMPPVTVCDNGGSQGDIPSTTGFRGVAAERLGDRLVLTTQMSAGWYRYLVKWTFYTDGRIEPRFGFSAVNATCVSNDHRHHVYWRFDFDIDDAQNDAIGAPPKDGNPRPMLATEGMRTLPDATKKPPYIVYDTVSNRGYNVVPGPENLNSPVGSAPSAGGPTWNSVTYPFDVTDAIMLQYKESSPGVPTEINDGAGLSQCALTSTFLNFMNNEALNDNGDVVTWYRGGGFHAGGALDTCTVVGPTLYPLGNWAIGAP